MTQKQHPLDFLIIVPFDRVTNGLEIVHELPPALNLNDREKITLYLSSQNKFRTMADEMGLIAIGGDPIGLTDDTIHPYASDKFYLEEFLTTVSGHYYLIYYNRHADKLIVASSLFSMYPVFWHRSATCILIASRLRLMLELLPALSRSNKKFIVEQVLFNYPLFNDTIVNDVMLCPTNHYLAVTGDRLEFFKFFDIADLFSEHPRQDKHAAETLTSLFLSRTRDYFLNTRLIIAFTSGFDSRTLVACAKYHQQEFTSFSFGTDKNYDVTRPLMDAARLGINYFPVLLDADYIESNYKEAGEELIDLTSAMSNYLYVHHLYSARKLSEQCDYLFTGYFGSELFRSIHLTGALISKELLPFFRERAEDRWIESIRLSSKLTYLKTTWVAEEIDKIITELRRYKQDYSEDRLTHFFYRFVFDEIFRKVFGPLIYSQSKYINVRTPFLDLEFISELLGTEFAGANNDFFTHNPLKRSIGQYLYAKIIATAYPELAQIKTQRGYAPDDLLTFNGKLSIIFPYTLQKVLKRITGPDLDNLSIISGTKRNWQVFRQALIASDWYEIEALDKIATHLEHAPEYRRDLLALITASAMFINQIEGR